MFWHIWKWMNRVQSLLLWVIKRLTVCNYGWTAEQAFWVPVGGSECCGVSSCPNASKDVKQVVQSMHSKPSYLKTELPDSNWGLIHTETGFGVQKFLQIQPLEAVVQTAIFLHSHLPYVSAQEVAALFFLLRLLKSNIIIKVLVRYVWCDFREKRSDWWVTADTMVTEKCLIQPTSKNAHPSLLTGIVFITEQLKKRKRRGKESKLARQQISQH